MAKQPPAPRDRAKDAKLVQTRGSDVNAFLGALAKSPKPRGSESRGRLLFGLDATGSREATWAQAKDIQAEMFAQTAHLGGLELSVCFFQGFGRFFATKWLTDGHALAASMAKVRCEGGLTQIERVLRHGLKATKLERLNGIIYVGDCVEENPDVLCDVAGQLGLLNVPCFVFQEGDDANAARTFKQIAQLSNGAYCRFDLASASTLKQLLTMVATFAAGGAGAVRALPGSRDGAVKQLAHVLGRGQS